MTDKPILFLPRPSRAHRLTKGGPAGAVHFPSHRRQVERLAPVFEALARAIRSGSSLRATAYATEPEQVLVLETVGPVENFVTAVQASGMDWLGEFDRDDIPPDDDFFDAKERSATLRGRVFLVMANQRGLEQMLSLWQRFEANPSAPFPRGSATLKAVFHQLRTVRRWGAADRLAESDVLGCWRRDLGLRHANVRFEAELFFRCDEIKRNKAFAILAAEVSAVGGHCVGQTVIREIAYHGVMVDLPASAVEAILARIDAGEAESVAVLRTEDVMFFRPGGQTVRVRVPDAAGAGTVDATRGGRPAPPGQRQPLVALLDGLPLSNHSLLAGRVIVDDPDGWEGTYPAASRCHGTGMASLIIHGELDAGEPPLSRPIYARPILRADVARPDAAEAMPDGVLPIDLTHRAVRRMMEGDGDDGPVAPHVKIVNLSVGDEARHFLGVMSPWARLIDWLAWKYKLLFVVSAGNHSRAIELDIPSTSGLTSAEVQGAVLKAVAADVRHRRLLAPAEAINALTVGAAHADRSTPLRIGGRRDPYPEKLPCPYNGLGPGYRRAVKPDVLFPGGRQLLSESRGNGRAVLLPADSCLQPGQRVASPGAGTGELGGEWYTRGTSNAAALATRCAAEVCENLINLRREPNGEMLSDRFLPIIGKGLIVHGARWGDAYATMARILSPGSDGHAFKEQAARFLGYGLTDPSRIMACASHRATLIGCGTLREDEADVFAVPLPPSLSGTREFRRLVVTLAWFTPISPKHRDYRRVALWFSDPSAPLRLDRADAHWQAVQRGTIQHEVFESDAAAVFTEGEALRVQVNCRADAGRPKDEPPRTDEPRDAVPYALIATLEVAETSMIPVYDEVRAALRVGVRVRSAG